MTEAAAKRVIVVSGPSGVGKSTIIHRVIEEDGELRLSVSSTTRPPRPGEEHARDYFFVDRKQFKESIAANAFLEWAQVYDNYYGTALQHVQDILADGHHALLDIDTQGTLSIKRACSGVVYVFVMPPSVEILAERLRLRGSESDRSFSSRMARAEHEMSFQSEYDYTVVNKELDSAVADFRHILDVEKSKPIRFERSA